MADVKQLEDIHKNVKEDFVYVSDERLYKKPEWWQSPAADYMGDSRLLGDCEDFALACRKLCRDAGIDNSRLVYCFTENKEGHCVLEVDGWIFDNRSPEGVVMNRDILTERGYEWVAISGYEPGDPWFRISNPE